MKKCICLLLALVMLMMVGCAPVQAPPATEAPKAEAPAAEAPAAEPAKAEEPADAGIATEITAPVSFDFWHAMTGENEAVLQEICDKFNAANEGKMSVNLLFQGGYKDMFAKLEGAAKAGNMPTMSMIYCNRLTAYVMSDLVENLNPYIESDKVGFTEEEWNNIPAFLRDNGMYDGIHYSLPFNKATYLLFYNVDMFEKYGVTPPTTWDELAAAAEALTVKDNGKDIIGLALNQSVAVDGSLWVEQAGGHLYDAANDKITFNEAPGVEAYEFLTGMVKAGHAKICTEESYITGPFGRGEVAMGITSMSNLPDIIATCAENGVNFATVVAPKGKAAAALFSGTDVTIFNTSTPEQKLAAFEFLKFFYQAENQFEWGTRSGYMPMNNAVLYGDEFAAYAEENNPAKLTSIAAFDYGYCDPKILNGYAIHDNMSKALDKVLLEGADIQTALNDAADQAWKEILQSRSSFQSMAG